MKSIYGRRSRVTMGSYRRSREEDKAMRWCIRNNICITPKQAVWGQATWYIEIEKGEYPQRRLLGKSPEAFGPGEIWRKISEYQTYYYDKHIREKI